MRTVFISHANQDAQFAHRLAADLQRLGVQVWIAPESIRGGEGWVKAIERGLKESSHMVVVLTPAALESKWVEKETEVAIARERRGLMQIIPLNVEPCEVPPLLSSYQRVPFRRDYDVGLSQLADILGVRITPPEPVRPPPHAPPCVSLAEAEAVLKEKLKPPTASERVEPVLAPVPRPAVTTLPPRPERAVFLPLRVIAIGWAIGWAIGLAIGVATGEAIDWAIALTISGAIGGLTTGLAFWLTQPPVLRDSVLIAVVGWSIGGATAGAIVWAAGSDIGLIIGGPMVWAIGGLTTGLALRVVEPSISRKRVLVVTIGWIIVWGISIVIGLGIGVSIVEAIGWPVRSRTGSPIHLAVVGAIGGAISGAAVGAIGRWMMLWQLD